MFQSKLNCEVLYDDLAFEVRWAVAGDSIILQLVAKLGKKKEKHINIPKQNLLQGAFTTIILRFRLS